MRDENGRRDKATLLLDRHRWKQKIKRRAERIKVLKEEIARMQLEVMLVESHIRRREEYGE